MTPDYEPRPGSIGQRSIEHLKIHGRMWMRDLADGIDADINAMTASLSLCIRHGLIEREDVDGKVWVSLPADAQPEAKPSTPPVSDGVQFAREPLADEQRRAAFNEDLQDDDARIRMEAEAMRRDVEDLMKPSIVGIMRASEEHGEEPRVERKEGSGIRVTVPRRNADGSFDEIDLGTFTNLGDVAKAMVRDAATPEPPPRRHFEFGLFSDGRLVIELDDVVSTLTRDQTERLYRFMVSIEGAIHAAA